jgi:hypothetical protein
MEGMRRKSRWVNNDEMGLTKLCVRLCAELASLRRRTVMKFSEVSDSKKKELDDEQNDHKVLKLSSSLEFCILCNPLRRRNDFAE